MREDSGFITKWLSVFPIGFGNAVIFLTVLSTVFFFVVLLHVCLLMNSIYLSPSSSRATSPLARYVNGHVFEAAKT